MGRQWTTSDAWVFASLRGIGPRTGYTLARLIGVADAINHGIPTEAQLVQAVQRLTAAGLAGADIQADRYWRTRAGRALYRRTMKRRDMFEWDAILPVLNQLGVPHDSDWSLPPGAFDQAVSKYLGQGGP